MRHVLVVVLLSLFAAHFAGFSTAAGAGGKPSAMLPRPLRFVRPAVFEGVAVKMLQIRRASPAASVGGGVVSFVPGALPAGSHAAAFWAGRKLAEGRAAADGSLTLAGLPQGLNAVWAVWSDRPVPDFAFERYGPTGTYGSWGPFLGFSGRLPAVVVYEQHSGYSDRHLCVWDGTRWSSVYPPSSSYDMEGLADDGTRVIFASRLRGYESWRIRGYVPGGSVFDVVYPDVSIVYDLFRGGDGKAYVWVYGGYDWQRKGLYRIDGSSLVQVAPLGCSQYAVAAWGEVFGVQIVGSGYCVRKWSGSAWLDVSCPLDASPGGIALSAGPWALWALSGGKACRLEGGVWSEPELPCGLPAQALYPAADGSCWAVVNDAGTLQLVQWTEEARWQLGPLMPQGAQWILGDDPEGNLWVGGPGSSPVPVYRLPFGLLR